MADAEKSATVLQADITSIFLKGRILLIHYRGRTDSSVKLGPTTVSNFTVNGYWLTFILPYVIPTLSLSFRNKATESSVSK